MNRLGEGPVHVKVCPPIIPSRRLPLILLVLPDLPDPKLIADPPIWYSAPAFEQAKNGTAEWGNPTFVTVALVSTCRPYIL